eukprot:6194412-Pleurochrysis_carterae.AAC.1
MVSTLISAANRKKVLYGKCEPAEGAVGNKCVVSAQRRALQACKLSSEQNPIHRPRTAIDTRSCAAVFKSMLLHEMSVFALKRQPKCVSEKSLPSLVSIQRILFLFKHNATTWISVC